MNEKIVKEKSIQGFKSSNVNSNSFQREDDD